MVQQCGDRKNVVLSPGAKIKPRERLGGMRYPESRTDGHLI